MTSLIKKPAPATYFPERTKQILLEIHLCKEAILFKLTFNLAVIGTSRKNATSDSNFLTVKISFTSQIKSI